MATLVWFGRDLRLSDNPALHAALSNGGAVVPVSIWSPEEAGDWPAGAASRWWLHGSLESLQGQLDQRGSRLILRRGPTAAALLDLARETGAARVYWNRSYEPAARALEGSLEQELKSSGLESRGFAGNLLFEPGTILNSSGAPFQVFTAFWNACLRAPSPPQPLPAPKEIEAPSRWPHSLALSDLHLLPAIDWAGGIRDTWTPGVAAAARELRRFLRDRAANYATGRDVPAEPGTSRISPYLHFGEVSARQIWHGAGGAAPQPYLRQIVWREFAHHLLHHFPHTPAEPLREQFRRFPWTRNRAQLKAWQRGRTGYPLVDAGMRELWHTGWMHNRVRMVVASFLVKHLLIDWREGARWFWDTLVDADLANNTLGWQWCAGCGADAAPYFRIFNPVAQGEKFDPEGWYVKRWVPELSGLAAKWIHRPWEAPTDVLRQAGIVLGESYPRPIVDHAQARARALDALAETRRGRGNAPNVT